MFKNHPKGIVVLFFTEMWERFGFYIMMAIFVLYMDKEFGWPDTMKGDHYGWFLMSVYFIPIAGGYLGDKLLGQIKTIRMGAILMVFGYIALALSSKNNLPFFYLGLGLVALGTGIFKVNISVLVGNLYKEKPKLKDAGYNIYYMGVNVGAAIAPLAATLFGFLVLKYGLNYDSYHISFWAAAAGMLLCLLIFEKGKSALLDSDIISGQTVPNSTKPVENTASESEDFKRITTLITLFIILIFFWVAFYQNGFALTLFAERSTIRSDILRPETYQFFNPFFILVLTLPLLGFFARLNMRGKEPPTPVKIFFGILIMSIAMLVMVAASWLGGNSDKNIMSPMWLIGAYLIVTLAEIMISPMGQSYVSKVAPRRMQGLMMGLWFSATAIGSYGSGFLGRYYSDFSHHNYFILLTGLLVFSAVLVLVFMKNLRRFGE